MVKKLGANINTIDTATQDGDSYTLNTSTATTISVANNNRRYFLVQNNDTKDVFIRLRTAASDNNKTGIFLPKNGGFWEMPVTDKFVGEISAIAVVDAPAVTVTEY